MLFRSEPDAFAAPVSTFGFGFGLIDVGLADDEGPAAPAEAVGSEADARASTRAARDERLCCPRRDSFGYSQTSPRRVHWLRAIRYCQPYYTLLAQYTQGALTCSAEAPRGAGAHTRSCARDKKDKP